MHKREKNHVNEVFLCSVNYYRDLLLRGPRCVCAVTCAHLGAICACTDDAHASCATTGSTESFGLMPRSYGMMHILRCSYWTWNCLQGREATMENSSCMLLNMHWWLRTGQHGEFNVSEKVKRRECRKTPQCAQVDEVNIKGKPREEGTLVSARGSFAHACILVTHCNEDILNVFL